MLALDDLLIREEMIHWQSSLPGIFGIWLIVTRSVRPPFELTIVEKNFARVENLSAFGN